MQIEDGIVGDQDKKGKKTPTEKNKCPIHPQNLRKVKETAPPDQHTFAMIKKADPSPGIKPDDGRDEEVFAAAFRFIARFDADAPNAATQRAAELDAAGEPEKATFWRNVADVAENLLRDKHDGVKH